MSVAAQYVAAGLGLLLLGAIHGALRNIADSTGRIALAQEKALQVVSTTNVYAPTSCPDYPPERS